MVNVSKLHCVRMLPYMMVLFCPAFTRRKFKLQAIANRNRVITIITCKKVHLALVLDQSLPPFGQLSIWDGTVTLQIAYCRLQNADYAEYAKYADYAKYP